MKKNLSVLLLMFGVIAANAQDIVAPEPIDTIEAKITPQAIEARIAQMRMGDFVVTTKPGTEVKIEQLRHEFLFGTAVANQVVATDEKAMSPQDRQRYIQTLSENFNYAVHENALKWYDCEKEPNKVDYATADKIWDICNELNIPMRGHCIFWEKDEFVQPWLKNLNNEDLRMAVKRRAIDMMTHFKGRITEYDLNNEMIHGDFFRRRLGYGIVNEMAYMSLSANPDAQFFVNDYGILVDGGFNASAYISQIDNLIKSGVPISGIGCQAHPATRIKNPMSPFIVQRGLDRLAKFNLPIKITEAFFGSEGEESMAQEMQTILPIYFAHPNVEAIVFWGFWEGTHWNPRSALWRNNWTHTPQGVAYRDLVFNKWWTRAQGKADGKGVYRTRAFYGDYLVTVNGKSQKVTLSKKDKEVVVTF